MIRGSKILHVRRVTDTQANALVGLAASLSLPEGKDHYVTVAGRRLSTPSPEVPQPRVRKGLQCRNGCKTHRGLADLIHGFY